MPAARSLVLLAGLGSAVAGPLGAQSDPAALARLGELVTACEAAWSGMAVPPALPQGALAAPAAPPALAPTTEAGMDRLAAAQEAQMRALETVQSGDQADQVQATLDAVAPTLGQPDWRSLCVQALALDGLVGPPDR